VKIAHVGYSHLENSPPRIFPTVHRDETQGGSRVGNPDGGFPDHSQRSMVRFWPANQNSFAMCFLPNLMEIDKDKTAFLKRRWNDVGNWWYHL